MELSPPALLNARHGLEGFDSSAPSLWKRLASPASSRQPGEQRPLDVRGLRRRPGGGLFLARLRLHHLVTATVGFQRNMPDPIAVTILARLAMDHRLQGRGGGKTLQAEAAKLVLAASAPGFAGGWCMR